MKNKKKLGLIGAIALTLFGTISLVAFVRSAEDRALADQEVVEVLVTTAPVPAGTPTEQLTDLVEVRRIPVAARTAGAPATLAEVAGLVTSIDLVADEQITTARLVAADDFAPSGAIEVPEGMMEVTVSLGPSQTVGGTLRAGELVALATSFDDGTTGLVLHKVLITKIQGEPVAEEPQPSAEAPSVAGTERTPIPSSGLLVTFAVDVESFQKIVFANQFGSIYLAREPAAAPEISVSPESRDSIYG